MKIEDLIKGGILTEIEIDKVSLVKSPANQRRFIISKQANLEFTGSTDQTFDGTTITVNGEELEDLHSFHFSAVNWSEEDMEEWGATPISLSFSTKKSTTDGLDVIETFSLHSEVKKMEKSEIFKATKSLGIELDEAGFDKLPVEKQKALEALAVFAPAMDGQPAFRDAVAVFAKSGTEAEPEGVTEDPPEAPAEAPAGAPAEKPSEEPKPDTSPTDTAAIITAIQEGFASLKKEPDKKPDNSEGEEGGETPSEPVTKAELEAFSKQLAAIAKAAGVKQSDEIDIAKSGGDKDEWGWGNAELN